jgi:N-acetylmuramoyl-L-alanine amidase
MPAVLIELGYLSNAAQEKLITGDAFQNAFVQAIYDTIVRFRDALASGATH